jgi:eight-cysteine-cluster-containing protein
MDNEKTPFSANIKQPGLGAVTILLIIGAILGFQLGRWSNSYELQSLLSPTPVSCTLEAKVCPDGSSVGRVPPSCEFAPCPFFAPPSPTLAATDSAKGGCVQAGCSGQLCVSENQSDIVTTCEMRDEYSCLQYSSCEPQKNGACGWTQTPSYTDCLNNLQR